jgi:hypothetical protein
MTSPAPGTAGEVPAGSGWRERWRRRGEGDDPEFGSAGHCVILRSPPLALARMLPNEMRKTRHVPGASAP